MSRDFVGALLQLNAEKQVSREQLIRTVEDAIAAAYRRVATGEWTVVLVGDAATVVPALEGRVTAPVGTVAL